MALYVDVLRIYPNAWGPFLKGSCHFFADLEDLDRLHAVALAIGLRRAWFQPDPRDGSSHYDLVPARRTAAIRHGAIEVDDRGAVRIWRSNREKTALARLFERP